MKYPLLLATMLCSWLAGYTQFTYPVLPEDTSHVNQFGYSIPDPFRGLEELDSKQTKDWLAQQAEIVQKYRNSMYGDYTIVRSCLANSYMASLTQRYVSNKIGAYYFSTRSRETFDKTPVVRFKRRKKEEWQNFLFTGQFQHNENDELSITGVSVSENDSLVAVSISHNGSDWHDIIIVHASSQKVLEKMEWMKSEVQWCKNGFVYERYEKPDTANGNRISAYIKNSAIYYHAIGADFSKDRLLCPASENEKLAYVTDDNRFLILYEARLINGRRIGTYSSIATTQAGKDTLHTFIMLPEAGPETIQVIGEQDGMFLTKSTYKAPKGKVMLYDYNKLNQGRQLIEMFGQNLLSAHYLNNKVICIYMDKGNNACIIFDNKGTLIKAIDVPPAAAITGFNKVYNDSITYYFVSTYTAPQLTLKFNLNTLKSSLPEDDAELSLGSKNVTEIVSYRSADSTEIFMYLIHKDGLKPNGNTPVLMYAYGGFGIAQRPHFDFTYNMLLEKGAIVAIPLIRGGGEFGTDWHNAGRKQNKQKSIDDVIAAARWLVDNGYTNSSKIGLTGGSQGGWLMAAAMVQHPEMFKAVVPEAGVYDLLRFHKYSRTGAIGYDEFGNPEVQSEFEYLAKISPYHLVKDNVKYPACMMVIGAQDDRVVPFHTYKLLAALQKGRNGNTPYLAYVEENAGHNVSNVIEGYAQITLLYTFIMKQLGIPIF